MKNLVLSLSILMGLLAWPVLASAQGTGSKVGVINIQEAIAKSAEGKKALAELQKKYQPREQDLQRQQQDITALQDQLQKQATTLSDEERVRLSRDLEEKQKIFKRASEDANADFQGDSQEVIRRVGQKMLRVIAEYAQQNNFALVIDGAQVPVYYVAKEIDLTDEIVKRYDAANPVESGTTAPAATGGASTPRPAAKTPVAPKPAKP
jgi:Skp family chaperone for outer membrane proteins